MERDLRVSRPIVKSSIAADREAHEWTDQQRIEKIVDGDGDVWAVSLKVEEAFESSQSEDFLYTVTIVMNKEVGVEDLLETGVLTKGKDFRMLALIGGARINLEMNPVQFKDRVEHRAKQAAREYLVTLRDKLKGQSLVEIKRRLIHSWIDQSGRFGRKNYKRLVARL